MLAVLELPMIASCKPLMRLDPLSSRTVCSRTSVRLVGVNAARPVCTVQAVREMVPRAVSFVTAEFPRQRK